NEDVGQMSAWAVWNMIGLYPANPVGGEYVIGSPMVDAITIKLKGNKKLEIEVLNNSHENKYVQSVKWNGVTYKKSYFLHKDIIGGGKIIFNMGPEPNFEWGSDDSWLPSSQSFAGQEAIVKHGEKGIFKSISNFFKNLF